MGNNFPAKKAKFVFFFVHFCFLSFDSQQQHKTIFKVMKEISVLQ